jgi:acetyl-CoA C-acetyltransferase
MSTASDPIVIVSAVRTPIGGLLGELSALQAWELGAVAVRAAVERAGVPGDAVDEVLMGNCLMAGQGQAPARQAMRAAGLPDSAGAVTLSKMCGSGMQAAIMGYEALVAGTVDMVVAGGMESMTNAPYALTKHRAGARIGHDTIVDTMMLDGLEDAYEPGKAMGVFAEEAVRDYQFTREEQDDYALRSLSRAKTAIAEGWFVREITPVTVSTRSGDLVIDTDEQPAKARPEKIPQLKPAFVKDGTVTPANSSSISDGAAALVLTRQTVADRDGLKPIARIVATASHAQAPNKFASAPVPAMRKVLDRAGWSAADVDLFEVNEAFAVVAMIAAKELAIPADKLNVNGGACALGHPIGASGARIIATLLGALETRGLKRGVASLCIGGGEATAIAVELV